jgi:molybdopterin synthase sulfur carrier subunit
MMKVRVLFFSVLKDLTGCDEVLIECPEGSTLADLLAEAYTRWPTLRAWDASLLLAVNQTYVKREAKLHHDAEVALMPPVQGG